MKGFKFKLEAVLKMRKLKEEQCKMLIGRIQVRIQELQGYLVEHNKGIDLSYESQEEALAGGLNGQELQFHPFFVSGKMAHIKIIEDEIKTLQAQAQEMYNELAQLRAQVKVIDEMKEEKRKKYKKEYEKKQFAEIEEQVQNWRQIVK